MHNQASVYASADHFDEDFPAHEEVQRNMSSEGHQDGRGADPQHRGVSVSGGFNMPR